MSAFVVFLRVLAPVFLLVAALHLVLGARADVLLGAHLPAEVLADPALDSQNRFYGVSFALYGVLLWLGAGDVPRFAPVLRCVLWAFLAAGLARLVSIVSHGAPPPMVLALLASELLVPPLALWWLGKVTRAS